MRSFNVISFLVMVVDFVLSFWNADILSLSDMDDVSTIFSSSSSTSLAASPSVDAEASR